MMKRFFSRRILPYLFVLALCVQNVANAQTPVAILDGGVEDSPNFSWITFGNAFLDEDNSPVFGLTNAIDADLGLESAKMFGNFSAQVNYTGMYQDIAVDGTNVSVGDLLQLTGWGATLADDSIFVAPVDPATDPPKNDAFLEITYVAGPNPDPGLPEGTEFGFGGARSANVGDLGEDEWFELFTTGSFVPEAAASVRIKAVFAQPATNDGGAAWFDDLSLNILPVAGLLCDADMDQDCDIADIDLLYDAFGTTGALDLDASGTIDAGDIDSWLTEASDESNPAKSDANHEYRNGDVNLDGAVNSTDLGILLNAFGDGSGLKFGGGNLNSDLTIDSIDLGILLNNFGHDSLSTAAVAVPEPTAAAMILFGLFGLVASSRRRR